MRLPVCMNTLCNWQMTEKLRDLIWRWCGRIGTPNGENGKMVQKDVYLPSCFGRVCICAPYPQIHQSEDQEVWKCTFYGNIVIVNDNPGLNEADSVNISSNVSIDCLGIDRSKIRDKNVVPISHFYVSQFSLVSVPFLLRVSLFSPKWVFLFFSTHNHTTA